MRAAQRDPQRKAKQPRQKNTDHLFIKAGGSDPWCESQGPPGNFDLDCPKECQDPYVQALFKRVRDMEVILNHARCFVPMPSVEFASAVVSNVPSTQKADQQKEGSCGSDESTRESIKSRTLSEESIEEKNVAPQKFGSEESTRESEESIDQLNVVTRTSGTHAWCVNSRILSGKDRQKASSDFVLAGGLRAKMIVKPKAAGDKRGQACFQKSKGVGFIEIKLTAAGEEESPVVRCMLSVGTEPARGPIELNMANGIMHGLPKDQEDWDLRKAANSNSADGAATFLVTLKVLPE